MLTFDDFSSRVIDTLQVDQPPAVTPYSDLYNELGLDSFQAFQLIVVIEALAGAEVPPPDLPEMYTMGDAFRYYQRMASTP